MHFFRMTPRSRSKDIVEPLLKPQWYVSCADMGKQAADAVREGRLRIVPDHHLKTWFNWMDNIRWVCLNPTAARLLAASSSSPAFPPRQGLVHFPAAVVGPPHPRLLRHCQRRLGETRRGTPIRGHNSRCPSSHASPLSLSRTWTAITG